MMVRLRLATWAELAGLVGRTDVLVLAREVRRPVVGNKATHQVAAINRKQPPVKVTGRARWARGGPGRVELVIDTSPPATVVWTQDEPLAHLTWSTSWFSGPVEVWLGRA